jgi:hypothetical protein
MNAQGTQHDSTHPLMTTSSIPDTNPEIELQTIIDVGGTHSDVVYNVLVQVTSPDPITFINCTFNGGLNISTGGHSVYNSTFYNKEIRVYYASDLLFDGNYISNTQSGGFVILFSENVQIINNTIFSYKDGVIANKGKNIIVDGNIIVSKYAYIGLHSDDVIVKNNYVNSTVYSPLYLTGSGSIVFNNTLITQSGLYGLDINHISDTPNPRDHYIYNNSIINPEGYGIRNSESHNSTFYNNSITCMKGARFVGHNLTINYNFFNFTGIDVGITLDGAYDPTYDVFNTTNYSFHEFSNNVVHTADKITFDFYQSNNVRFTDNKVSAHDIIIFSTGIELLEISNNYLKANYTSIHVNDQSYANGLIYLVSNVFDADTVSLNLKNAKDFGYPDLERGLTVHQNSFRVNHTNVYLNAINVVISENDFSLSNNSFTFERYKNTNFLANNFSSSITSFEYLTADAVDFQDNDFNDAVRTDIDQLAPEYLDGVLDTSVYNFSTSINWTFRDALYDNYEIFLEGTLVKFGAWENNVPITISLQDYAEYAHLGRMNLTCVVYDKLGQSNSVSTFVTLIDNTPPVAQPFDDPLCQPDQSPCHYEINFEESLPLEWRFEEFFPDRYEIWINDDELADHGKWITTESDNTRVGTISYLFNDYYDIFNEINEDLIRPSGVYNITVIVFDTSGNSNSQTVICTILPDTTTPTSETSKESSTPWHYGFVLCSFVCMIYFKRND